MGTQEAVLETEAKWESVACRERGQIDLCFDICPFLCNKIMPWASGSKYNL